MSTHDALPTDDSRIATETFEFANSTVTLNPSATDPIARVEHDTGATEFIGPLDDTTVAALREVADE